MGTQGFEFPGGGRFTHSTPCRASRVEKSSSYLDLCGLVTNLTKPRKEELRKGPWQQNELCDRARRAATVARGCLPVDAMRFGESEF